MAKYKLTKTVKNEIKKAIKDLPPYPSGAQMPVQMTGSTLLSRGYKTVNGGESIDPDRVYVGMDTVYVDHYKQAQREYAEGGVLSLTAYLVKVLEYDKNRNANTAIRN